MEKEKYLNLLQMLEGIQLYEWEKLKRCVDALFNETAKNNTLTVNKSVVRSELLI